MSTVAKTTKRTKKAVKTVKDQEDESNEIQEESVKVTKRSRKTVKTTNDSDETKTTKRTKKVVKTVKDHDDEINEIQDEPVKVTKRSRKTTKQQTKIINADDILNEIIEQPNETDVVQETPTKQKQIKSKQNEDIIQHPPNKFISMSLDSITHKNEDLIETEEQQMKQRIIILERRLDEKSIEINDLKITIYNLEQRLNKVINNLYKTADDQPMDLMNELMINLNE